MERSAPIVSVIVPLYNAEKFLHSIFALARELPNDQFEIVLVNDGSLDETGDTIEKHLHEFSNVIYLTKENGGVADARNVGMRAATGKFLLFMDQDDQLNVGNLIDSLSFIARNECDLILFDAYRETRFKKSVSMTKICKKTGYVLNTKEVKELLVWLLERQQAPSAISNYGFIWGCLISKKFININEIFFKKFINYEDDMTFLFDCISCNANFCLLQKQIYLWSYNSTSQSKSTKTDLSFLKNLRILGTYYESHWPTSFLDDRKSIMENFYALFFCYFIADFSKSKENSRSNRRVLSEIIDNNQMVSLFNNRNVKFRKISKKVLVILTKSKQFWLLFVLSHLGLI